MAHLLQAMNGDSRGLVGAHGTGEHPMTTMAAFHVRWKQATSVPVLKWSGRWGALSSALKSKAQWHFHGNMLSFRKAAAEIRGLPWPWPGTSTLEAYLRQSRYARHGAAQAGMPLATAETFNTLIVQRKLQGNKACFWPENEKVQLALQIALEAKNTRRLAQAAAMAARASEPMHRDARGIPRDDAGREINMGYFGPKGGVPSVQWELISVMKQLGLEPTNWMDAGRSKLIGTMQAEIKLHVAKHGEAPVRRRNKDGTIQPLPGAAAAAAPARGSATAAPTAPGAPPRTMTPPRRAASAPQRRGPRHGVEAQERMAAQVVAQAEAQARRSIQLFNIGDSAPSSFQTAQSAAPLTQTTALAMGFTLSPEQQAAAAEMASAMTDVDEPVSEPAPSIAPSTASSGVLVPHNTLAAHNVPVPNW